MQRNILVLALLIAGLVFSPFVYAADNDPDSPAGLDLHDEEVVESLCVGVSDLSSGNAVQVGPVGGVYRGSVSSTTGNSSGQAYSGACVLESLTFTPKAADTYANSVSAQAFTGEGIVTVVNLTAEADDEYIELYDGTARGNFTNCLLDVQSSFAFENQNVSGLNIYISEGLYVYSSATGGPHYEIIYHKDDYLEIYNGTSRTAANIVLDVKAPIAGGTFVYNGAPIEMTTGIYAYTPDINNYWSVQYRIEDQSE